MSGRRGLWVRGAVSLAVLSGMVAAALMSPVGAAFNPTKKKIKTIARKQATQVFEQGASELTVRCPADTTPFAGSCVETSFRPTADFVDASVTCATAGRRLPTVSELLAYEAAGHTLGSMGSREGTSDVHREGSSIYWWGVEDGGVYGPEARTTALAFRCVASLSN